MTDISCQPRTALARHRSPALEAVAGWLRARRDAVAAMRQRRRTAERLRRLSDHLLRDIGRDPEEVRAAEGGPRSRAGLVPRI